MSSFGSVFVFAVKAVLFFLFFFFFLFSFGCFLTLTSHTGEGRAKIQNVVFPVKFS